MLAAYTHTHTHTPRKVTGGSEVSVTQFGTHWTCFVDIKLASQLFFRPFGLLEPTGTLPSRRESGIDRDTLGQVSCDEKTTLEALRQFNLREWAIKRASTHETNPRRTHTVFAIHQIHCRSTDGAMDVHLVSLLMTFACRCHRRPKIQG